MTAALLEPDTDIEPDTGDGHGHWACCLDETLCGLPLAPDAKPNPDCKVDCVVCVMLADLKVPCSPQCRTYSLTIPYVQPAPRQPPVPGVESGAWDHVERLAAARRAAAHRELTEEERRKLDEMEGDRCFYCKGFHARYCPRIREIEFHQNGNLARVAYWHDNQVNWDNVVFDDPPETTAPEPE